MKSTAVFCFIYKKPYIPGPDETTLDIKQGGIIKDESPNWILFSVYLNE